MKRLALVLAWSLAMVVTLTRAGVGDGRMAFVFVTLAAPLLYAGLAPVAASAVSDRLGEVPVRAADGATGSSVAVSAARDHTAAPPERIVARPWLAAPDAPPFPEHNTPDRTRLASRAAGGAD